MEEVADEEDITLSPGPEAVNYSGDVAVDQISVLDERGMSISTRGGRVHH